MLVIVLKEREIGRAKSIVKVVSAVPSTKMSAMVIEARPPTRLSD